MEDSSTKLLLTWDVELTRVYDQFTNTWTNLEDVTTTVTAEIDVSQLIGTQVNDHTYDVDIPEASVKLRSAIEEADYFLLDGGPQEEVYKIRDTHQGAEIDFHWGTNFSGVGFRYISKLWITGSFRRDSFDHSDDYNAILYLNDLIGQRFVYVESGTARVSYGLSSGKEYRGDAFLKSVEVIPASE